MVSTRSGAGTRSPRRQRPTHSPIRVRFRAAPGAPSSVPDEPHPLSAFLCVALMAGGVYALCHMEDLVEQRVVDIPVPTSWQWRPFGTLLGSLITW